MLEFLFNNWLSIFSIVVGVVASYVFYRLASKQSISAAYERKKRATSELLDVVESYIVNKQKLSGQVVTNLIAASERDHNVALVPSTSALSLLQDVSLRLQRSRHLDVTQKTEYSEEIETLITGLQSETNEKGRVNGPLARSLDELLGLVPQQHKTRAKELTRSIALSSTRRSQSHLFELNAAAVAVGILSALTAAFSGFAVETRIPSSAALKFDSNLLLVLVTVAVALVVISLAFYVFTKNLQRRRSIDFYSGETVDWNSFLRARRRSLEETALSAAEAR